MTFAGVFTELLCREGNPTEFDVYLRLGAAEAAKDATIGVAVIDPQTGAALHRASRATRAMSNGTLESVMRLEVEFPREDKYFLEVWLDDMFVDAHDLEVYFEG